MLVENNTNVKVRKLYQTHTHTHKINKTVFTNLHGFKFCNKTLFRLIHYLLNFEIESSILTAHLILHEL
jgi:hypothetical protein